LEEKGIGSFETYLSHLKSTNNHDFGFNNKIFSFIDLLKRERERESMMNETFFPSKSHNCAFSLICYNKNS